MAKGTCDRMRERDLRNTYEIAIDALAVRL